MILYSIVPTEVVFGNNSQYGISQCIELDYMGEKVEVSPLENNKYVIRRLISTSLEAYLNPVLQPGTIIEK